MEKLNNKKLMLMLAGWFLISFFIMWILGGACTNLFVAPSEVNSVCIAKEGVSGLRNIPLIGNFLPYTQWVSLFYWFAPITGFIFALFIINWWNDYFETKEAKSIIFPIILIVVLLAGYYVNLSWYYGEAAALNTRNNVQVGLYFCFENEASDCSQTVSKINNEYISQAQNSGASTITQFIGVNYWPELRDSVFLTFVLGALSAWLFLFSFEKVFNKDD